MKTQVEKLGDARYVLVTTFRKDGTGVPTPVWVVPEGEGFAAWTGKESGKMKRIRRSRKITVVPCTFRGLPIGDPADATVTEIRRGAEAELIRRRIEKKYGLMGRIITGFEKRGKEERVAFVVRAA